MKFTESHEWINVNADGQTATIGVTEFAQKELGEIVYVELPEVGKEVRKEAAVAVLESTKAAADVYAPISGLITEVNSQLKTQSELVNRSPEKEGWIFKIKFTNRKELEGLMDESAYRAKFKS